MQCVKSLKNIIKQFKAVIKKVPNSIDDLSRSGI